MGAIWLLKCPDKRKKIKSKYFITIIYSSSLNIFRVHHQIVIFKPIFGSFFEHCSNKLFLKNQNIKKMCFSLQIGNQMKTLINIKVTKSV